MRTMPLNQSIPPYFYFEIDLRSAIIYDSTLTIPMIYGDKPMVDLWLTKKLPKTTTIQYYWRRSIKSINGSFVWRNTYEGLSPAHEAESQETQKQSEPKVET